jgi:hypothetical protein
MDALTSAKRVHYFDTRLHRILCGFQGFEQRSTKHARDVNCEACVGLLRERATAPGPDAAPAAAP